MKNIFLTSDMGCCKKVDGVYIANSIDNKNSIVNQIKLKLNKEIDFMFICSDPSGYEKNDIYSNITFKSFNMSGFSFKNLIIVDNRYRGDLKEDIKKADIIFLAGGHTPTEMKFFESLNLRELLKDYEGVIIGQSAGSLNLADTVVCTPEYEEEIGTKYTWRGLGLTNINIEPHFVVNVVDELDKKFREELLKISESYVVYAICDGTHIYDNGLEQIIYGESYLLSDRKIEKICDKNQSFNINKTIK